jgi:uncharacterized membrane protein YfcA
VASTDVTPVIVPETDSNTITIAGQVFSLGDSERTRELQTLQQIVERESGHKQWEKQGINILILALQILMNLFMGSRSVKSIVGIKNCSSAYWTLYCVFLLVCVKVTLFAVYRARQEQMLKIKYGRINMVESDIIFDNRTIMIVVSLGFFAGMLAGALGLGGGSIYNPILLSLGVPPLVSAASSLYLVQFSKTATTICYFVYGYLPLA